MIKDTSHAVSISHEDGGSRRAPARPLRRKLSRVATLVIASVLLVGCGSSNSTTTTVRGPALTVTTPPPTTPAPGDRNASAKALARTAQTAAETFAVDKNGSYAGMTAGALRSIEPTIQVASGQGPYLSQVEVTNGGNGYMLQVSTTDGGGFVIKRDANGNVTRHCSAPASTGGCLQGTW